MSVTSTDVLQDEMRPSRPPAERFMRRLLFIPSVTDTREGSYRLFSTSILISATRCVLSYVIFPILAPAIGQATGAGPAIGLIVGIVALVFDVLSIRRFWASDHRLRWPMTAVYAVVMVMVSVLVAQDIAHFLS